MAAASVHTAEIVVQVTIACKRITFENSQNLSWTPRGQMDQQVDCSLRTLKRICRTN